MGAAAIVFSTTLNSVISEVLDPAAVPGAASADKRTVVHDDWAVDETFNASSTPDPVRTLVMEITIDATGIYDLDLTAAPTTAAPTAGEDLTGKRVMYFEATTPEANVDPVVICDQAGASKYDMLGAGNELELQPNSKLPLLVQSSTLPAVAAGAKIIRFTGTEDDVVQVKFVFE